MVYQYTLNMLDIYNNYSELKGFIHILLEQRIIRAEKYYFEKNKIRYIIAELLLCYILHK
jgi:hypothetical protein